MAGTVLPLLVCANWQLRIRYLLYHSPDKRSLHGVEC